MAIDCNIVAESLIVTFNCYIVFGSLTAALLNPKNGTKFYRNVNISSEQVCTLPLLHHNIKTKFNRNMNTSSLQAYIQLLKCCQSLQKLTEIPLCRILDCYIAIVFPFSHQLWVTQENSLGEICHHHHHLPIHNSHQHYCIHHLCYHHITSTHKRQQLACAAGLSQYS